jgi:hypothetical protein
MTDSTKQKTLGAAMLMTALVWEAIKAGEINLPAGDPRKLLEIEEMLRTGKASLGVYLERSGERLYLCAALVHPGESCPFSGSVLEARGTVEEALAAAAGIGTKPPDQLH